MKEPLHASPEDLTARARIRDAALAEFAEHGIERATIRGIAKAAAVSPGLVQHHFGSKDALRLECDQFVVAFLRREKKRGYDQATAGQPDYLTRVSAASEPIVRYLSRALVEGSRGAQWLFDEIVEQSEAYLAKNAPKKFPRGARATRDLAAVMTSMHLGVLVLQGHLSRALGVDSLSAEAMPRVGLAMLEIYAGNTIDKNLIGTIQSGLAAVQVRDKDTKKRSKRRKRSKR